MAEEKKNYDLEERTINFAVRIIRLVEALPKTKAGNHNAEQLIHYGISPAPNCGKIRGELLDS